MSYVDWYAGMPLVCMDASGDMAGYRLEESRIYTLAEIRLVNRFCRREGQVVERLGVKLQEVPSGIDWFLASRFRPVQPRKASIAIFTAMLNEQERTVDA